MLNCASPLWGLAVQNCGNQTAATFSVLQISICGLQKSNFGNSQILRNRQQNGCASQMGNSRCILAHCLAAQSVYLCRRIKFVAMKYLLLFVPTVVIMLWVLCAEYRRKDVMGAVLLTLLTVVVLLRFASLAFYFDDIAMRFMDIRKRICSIPEV